MRGEAAPARVARVRSRCEARQTREAAKNMSDKRANIMRNAAACGARAARRLRYMLSDAPRVTCAKPPYARAADAFYSIMSVSELRAKGAPRNTDPYAASARPVYGAPRLPRRRQRHAAMSDLIQPTLLPS